MENIITNWRHSGLHKSDGGQGRQDEEDGGQGMQGPQGEQEGGT